MKLLNCPCGTVQYEASAWRKLRACTLCADYCGRQGVRQQCGGSELLLHEPRRVHVQGPSALLALLLPADQGAPLRTMLPALNRDCLQLTVLLLEWHDLHCLSCCMLFTQGSSRSKLKDLVRRLDNTALCRLVVPHSPARASMCMPVAEGQQRRAQSAIAAAALKNVLVLPCTVSQQFTLHR